MVAQKVQIILIQSDEKWFYSLVVRQFCKLIPIFGCTPVNHAVHHKSHIGKVLAFVMTGFVPLDNNFEKGGTALKILIKRAGAMVEAKRNTYKRVYRTDGSGTFHYPKLPNNILRKKGEDYFESRGITGSNEGTDGNRKFPLLALWDDHILPQLDAISQQYEAATNKRVIIVEQDDNATPHRDKKLKDYKEKEFAARGWEIRPQPSNSPLTNIQDAGFFPAMAKLVTEHQGLFNGSHYLQGEALWDAVVRVYEEYSLETLAKLYVHHGQIVNTIIQCKGGDEFVTESQSLHCGVRSVMAPVYATDQSTTPCGVEMMKDMTPVDVAAKLRYKKPNITAEYWASGAHEEGHKYNPLDHLSPNLLDAFNHYADHDQLDSDYFKEAYDKLDVDNIDNPLD